MSRETDVLIIGGGLVGASLACALGQAGVRVTMVEASPVCVDQQSAYDERSIALAQGSQRIFSGLGLWQSLQDQVCPIHTIHVSDRGHFGFTRLRREEEGVPALGYVATARVLGKALFARLDELDTVEVLAPAQLVDFRVSRECVARLDELDTVEVLAPAQLVDFRVSRESVEADLTLDGTSLTCTAKLLVAADGAQSSIRAQLIAYERFTDTGPMALLPMTEQRSALVWTVRSDQSDAIMELDDAQFLSRLQARFGYRLGRFLKVGQRHAYPLYLLRARESVRPRMALIGNAIHTLHPVAGQGFNLGLRDVATLAEVIMDAQRNGRDIGGSSVLERYADWRQAECRYAGAGFLSAGETLVRPPDHGPGRPPAAPGARPGFVGAASILWDGSYDK
jgi:2-octaprenyl-6-methoxyphenol hydroxylase